MYEIVLYTLSIFSISFFQMERRLGTLTTATKYALSKDRKDAMFRNVSRFAL